MQIRFLTTMTALAIVAAAMLMGGGPPSGPQYTIDFKLEDSPVMLPDGGNEYFSLQPGTFLRLRGVDDDESIKVEITALRDIRPVVYRIEGRWKLALCRVIEEKEWIDGELAEISLNYFARCPRTNNIYYFGEDVDIYEDGDVVSHDGAWLAGEDDALPGLIMPSLVLAGSRYYQEIAPGIAEDRAEHIKTTAQVQTPAGLFTHCLRIIETSPLEPGAESTKVYAPGIGLVQDDEILLVKHRKGERFVRSSDRSFLGRMLFLLRIFGLRF